MPAAVRKLGNSSGIIIPKSLLRLGMAEGDHVEMTLEVGRIVLVGPNKAPHAGELG